MISLFTRFRGTGAQYSNYIYISSQKAGSTMIAHTGTRTFNFDDTNIKKILDERFQMPNVEPTLRLFIRDPLRRYLSGCIENMFMDVRKAGNYYKSDYFSETLYFKNNREWLDLKMECDDKYDEWNNSQYISESDKELVYKLSQLYFRYQAETEIYIQTHTMPFYTAFYGLLIREKINFETLHLEDFNFPLTKMQQKNEKHLKHTKKIYIETVNKAFDDVAKPALLNMLETEQVHYEKLKKFMNEEIAISGI